MKRILCIILIASLAFTMFSCGKPGSAGDDLTPALTADAFLKALKAGDMDLLQQYYEGDVSDFSLEEEIDDPVLLALVQQMIEKILDFDYTLDNEQINGSSATVDVLFKTYDFEGILKDLTGSIFSNIMSLGIFNMSEEDIEKKIYDVLSDELSEALKSAEKTKDANVTIKLVKKSGKWMVKDMNRTDDLMHALSGGISKFAEDLEKMAG